MKLKNDFFYMGMALNEAKKGQTKDEVPVGALIVNFKNEILALAHNKKELEFNSLAHAELLAIQKASSIRKNWRLNDCTLYVTLEPCPMCMAALVQARIKRLVFGAYDFKGGALSLGYLLHNDRRLNHKFDLVGGVLQSESAYLLSSFFQKKRVF